ncbi:SDR family NAD(P)-dependent oxidoreductase [Mycolicibacterium phlei]
MTRVAVITGGAGGIGAAVVTALQGRGYRVASLDRSPAPAADHSSEADVSDAAAVAAAIDEVRTALGPVAAAVAVAGHYEMVPVAEITAEAWHRMLRVHLGGVANLARACAPDLIAGQGTLVAITSELAVGGGDGDSHYAAAKGAVIGFARSLAAELGPEGVRVNAVAPGPTDTPLLAADNPCRTPKYLNSLPIRRLARTDEVARCVEYLVCDAPFANGEVLNVNSGAVI